MLLHMSAKEYFLFLSVVKMHSHFQKAIISKMYMFHFFVQVCNWNSNRYLLVLWPYILLHCTYIHVNMQIRYKTAFAAQLSRSFGKDGLYYLYPWVMLHKCVCTHCNLLVLSQVTMSTIFFACGQGHLWADCNNTNP